MATVRPPAVAGFFYPDDATQLAADVDTLLATAPAPPDARPPKAVVAPHAGYRYSGILAARAFNRFAPLRGTVTRVVLLGPSHRVGFQGLALCGADYYETPLGRVPVDHAWEQRLAGKSGVGVLAEAHAAEHCLEVEVPFLQRVLGDISLVPVVCGGADPELVAEVLQTLWGGPETVIVISSDLSHFLDYATCKTKDAGTAAAIDGLDPSVLGPEEACGHVAVNGLLALARRRGLDVEALGVINSGDTAGTRDRVVGYGAWAFHDPANAMPA